MKVNIDKELIKEKIEQIESSTTGELVPMIIDKSDNYPAAHFRLAVLLGFFFPVILYYLPYIYIEDPAWYFVAQVAGIVLGHFLAYNARIKRMFTTSGERAEEVHQRALQAFYENNLHTTKDHTAILLYVSLLERKVEILADAGINQKIEKNFWKKKTKSITQKIKKEGLTQGILHGLDILGEPLKEHFPGTHDDVNELSDEIIIKKNGE